MGKPPQPKGSPRTEMGLALLKPLVERYKGDLDAMSEAQRIAFVDRARTTTRWPRPGWMEDHWRKHWAGVAAPAAYAAWVQDVKNRSTTEVWAFIHILTRRRSLAFIDPVEGAIVWVDAETMENVSGFRDNVQRFMAGKDFDYWRLKETEL